VSKISKIKAASPNTTQQNASAQPIANALGLHSVVMNAANAATLSRHVRV